MNPDDEDDRPGLYSTAHVCGAAAHATSSSAGRSQSEASCGEVGPAGPIGASHYEREGDTGAGRIDVPAVYEPLSDDDIDRQERAKTQKIEEERQRIEELLASEEMIFRLPQFVVGPLMFCVLIAIFSTLGLFVLATVTSTVSAIGTFPAWAQALCWTALLLLLGALLLAAGRFLLAYLRLKPNQPLVLKGLAQLSQRTLLRWLVHEKKAQAKAQLVTYLRGYPLESARGQRSLTAAGLSLEDLEKLNAARKELLDGNRFANHDQWFQDFHSGFEGLLDKAAQARINYYAWRVAVGTALSPNALLAMILVSYGGFAMLADLCQIYHLRVGRLGTAILLVRVFLNAYLAGQISDHLQQATEHGIDNVLQEIGMHLHSAAWAAVTGKVAGKLGSRTATGVLNYLLMKRLGKRGLALLRPVR